MHVYCSSKNDNEVTSVVIPEGLTKSILDKAGFATKVAVREIDKAGYLRRQGNGKRNGLKSDFRINHVRRTCYQFRFCDESTCKGEKLIDPLTIHSVYKSCTRPDFYHEVGSWGGEK